MLKGNPLLFILGAILILGYFFGMVGLLFPKLGPFANPCDGFTLQLLLQCSLLLIKEV